jgi:hypothetical protein
MNLGLQQFVTSSSIYWRDRSVTPCLRCSRHWFIHNFHRGNKLGLNQLTKGSNAFFVLQHTTTFPSLLNTWFVSWLALSLYFFLDFMCRIEQARANPRCTCSDQIQTPTTSMSATEQVLSESFFPHNNLVFSRGFLTSIVALQIAGVHDFHYYFMYIIECCYPTLDGVMFCVTCVTTHTHKKKKKGQTKCAIAMLSLFATTFLFASASLCLSIAHTAQVWVNCPILCEFISLLCPIPCLLNACFSSVFRRCVQQRLWTTV